MKPLAIALLLYTGSAAAQGIDFKGVQIGASEAEVLYRLPTASCKPSGSAIAERVCSTFTDSFGGARATFLFFIDGGKTSGMMVSVDEKEFDNIVRALVAKYGAATDTQAPIVENRMGAKFTNDTFTWMRGEDVLTARRFATTLSRSSFSVTNRKSIEQFKERKKEETDNRAKDL